MQLSTRVESCGPLALMGVALYGNPSTIDFHNAWVHFGKVADACSLPRVRRDLYGLQLYPPTFPTLFEFTYLACIETPPGMEVPIHMLTKRIPRCSYVIQPAEHGLRGVDPALEYLYKEYIPKHGLRVAMPFDFEKYCGVDGPETIGAPIEVWVPVLV